MFKTIAKIAGAIMLAAWAAVGETQNILGVFNNAPNIVKWSPLIALLLLFVLLGWIWFGMNRRIEQLEDKQPSVKVSPIFVGDSVFLEIQNTGNSDAEFYVQVLRWQGIEKINPPINREYNTKWLNNLRNPNEPIFKILPHQHNRVTLIHTLGLKSYPEDKIQLQNVQMPSQFETWQGQVQIENPITVSVQIGANPKLKNETRLSFIFLVDKNGNWRLKE
jgi:hypothetical protein